VFAIKPALVFTDSLVMFLIRKAKYGRKNSDVFLKTG